MIPSIGLACKPAMILGSLISRNLAAAINRESDEVASKLKSVAAASAASKKRKKSIALLTKFVGQFVRPLIRLSKDLRGIHVFESVHWEARGTGSLLSLNSQGAFQNRTESKEHLDSRERMRCLN